jgi:hypothetical protein
MMVNYTDAGYRAKIILLKNNGYTISEIRRMATNHHHDRNIRKWILHHFNEKRLEGVISKIHKHKSIKMTDDIKKRLFCGSSQKFKNRL